jgi:hypothetical protein
MQKAMNEGEFDSACSAAEATNWYWLPFFQTLSQDPRLQDWPLTLYTFNPRLTAQYKGIFCDQDKTDSSDAWVIAEQMRNGRQLPSPFQIDAKYLSLRFLTRYRHHLVKNLVREKNYCMSVLNLKASEYRQDHPFSNVFGATSQALIQ